MQSTEILAFIRKQNENRQMFDIAHQHAPESTQWPRQILGL